MALTNNFISPTSLVFGVRDFLPQIESNQKQDREGLQNAFKFATQVYDAIKNRQIADEMNSEDPDYKKIDSLAAQRINNPDTSFSNWRWKQGQDQAAEFRKQDLERIKAEKDAAKELAKRQALNKVTNTLGTINIGLNTTPDQIQQYRNTLAGLMTEAQNAGLEDLSSITEMQKQLDEPLPYEKMANLKDQMDLYNKNFESVVGEGTYGSNKDYATYVKNLDDIWYQSSPEMRRDRDFRMAYEAAKAARAPKKKNKPRFRRK
jgi:hypothetical protein